VVIILFIFGGGAIEDFALVMLLGVIVGTYSSIFVASSVVSIWNEKEEGKEVLNAEVIDA
jgi:preprotein translocase subunit SecF